MKHMKKILSFKVSWKVWRHPINHNLFVRMWTDEDWPWHKASILIKTRKDIPDKLNDFITSIEKRY